MKIISFINKNDDYLRRFLIIGLLNTALDFLLFFIFADLLSIYPVISSIFSTGIVMCLSFYLNHNFVFKSKKNKKNTFIQFFIVSIFNVWIVQSVIIYLSLQIFKNFIFFLDHSWTLNMFSKLCGISFSFVLNFLMYRYIFHKNIPNEVIA